MHIYFSGIGGTAIGPLALIAHKAGFQVSGSDKQQSQYIAYLEQHGVTDIHIGQTYDHIAETHNTAPIDWFVYTSALPMEQPDAPELAFCAEHAIRTSKRDAFLNYLLSERKLKMIAIAGTHGKTTTTAMTIWLFKQLGIPLSYSVGAKMSFADMGDYDPKSEYFVYEADEFDRNFLSFEPRMSIITGIDYDHPDIYPTLESYNQAFHEFLEQSEAAVLWQDDAERLALEAGRNQAIISKDNPDIEAQLHLPGLVNRQNAWIVAQAIHALMGRDMAELIKHLNAFPGVGRRFERIIPNLYTDYAHTPPKIRGALQTGREVAGDNNLIVIYEGLHNTRQHFIQKELHDLFADAHRLYIVPTYLAREDPNLPVWTPQDLKQLMAEDIQAKTVPAALDNQLATALENHIENGDTVLAITAGGGRSLDEWLRQNFTPTPHPLN